jgi:hypothetical protein
MISSDPDENGWIQANDCLVSPPRNWPASFKANKTLSSFLNKTLKAKKARLTSLPVADVVAETEAASLPPRSHADSAYNADRVHDTLGWPVLRGFAVYELAEDAGIFVARPYSWNAHPRNIWVDMTPREKHLSDILLVEADVDAALIRAGLKKPPPPSAPPADAPPDVSDAQPAAPASGAPSSA